MKLKSSAPVIRVALLLACGSLQAGVKISASVKETKEKLPLNLFLDKTKVRMDAQSGPDGSNMHRVIYDGATDNLAYLDPKRKTAMQVPMAQLEFFASMAAKFQKGQKIQGPQPGPKKTFGFKNTGHTRKVGAWTCRVFELTKQSKKVGELCAASLKDVGLTAADLVPLQKLSRSLRPLIAAAPAAPEYPDYLWEKLDELGLTVEAKGEDPELKKPFLFQISTISRENLPADTFTVPADFKAQTFGIGK